jgi:Yip1 domain
MNLVDRVKNILMTPKSEWPVIDTEPGDAAYLSTNYVAILAAIPAICGFIGTSIIGISIGGATFRFPILTGIVHAIVSYILSFVIVYVVAMIVDALAPSFGGRKDMQSALKVTVYSYTPGWLVGVFLLIPALGVLGLLALYGLYLMYLGLPVLMKAPPERSLMYTIVVVVCTIVLVIVLGFIQAAIFGLPRM